MKILFYAMISSLLYSVVGTLIVLVTWCTNSSVNVDSYVPSIVVVSIVGLLLSIIYSIEKEDCCRNNINK